MLKSTTSSRLVTRVAYVFSSLLNRGDFAHEIFGELVSGLTRIALEDDSSVLGQSGSTLVLLLYLYAWVLTSS